MKVLSIKWVENGKSKIISDVRVIELSAKSAELNIKVHSGSQYPKYAPVSDINKYCVEVTKETVKSKEVDATPVVIQEVNEVNEVVETETNESTEPVKRGRKKPTFKTVAEKTEWEKENSN